MKDFLKSAWFKCTLVLLVISCIAGALLSILSDVLYVSPEERTARAMSKIYGQSVEISETILDIYTFPNAITNEYGSIKKIYKINGENDAYDLIFQSTGVDGYKGGKITLWLQVEVTKTTPNGKFKKVVLESYDKQTLMSKFDAVYYENFVKNYQDGVYFTAKNENGKITNLSSGATYSSTANCNAVNCIIYELQGIIAQIGGNN